MVMVTLEVSVSVVSKVLKSPAQSPKLKLSVPLPMVLVCSVKALASPTANEWEVARAETAKV